MSDEVERAKTTGDPIVSYCSVCGIEFEAKFPTNRWFQCDGCDSILQVRYKENKNQITMDDP